MIVNEIELSSPQETNTTVSNDKIDEEDESVESLMVEYGVYIFVGCGLFLVLVALAIILFCFVKRSKDKKEMQSTDDEAKFEDDGYDYIGQLELNQQNVRGVAIDENPPPMNQNEDRNTIQVSQNPYYEEGVESRDHEDSITMAETGPRMEDHITKLENPYYEGI